MPGCLFPGELSVLPSPGSWKGTDTVPAPLTCPWPPGRWGPGMWFCARSALAAAAGDTKIPFGMSTVVVQPDPTAVTGADVQGKLSPTLLGKGRGTETIPKEMGQLREQHSKMFFIAPAGMLRQPFLFLFVS